MGTLRTSYLSLGLPEIRPRVSILENHSREGMFESITAFVVPQLTSEGLPESNVSHLLGSERQEPLLPGSCLLQVSHRST